MPQDYIDTQGLSPKMSPEEAAKYTNAPQKEHKPMQINPRRLHTPTMVKELKILINPCQIKSGIAAGCCLPTVNIRIKYPINHITLKIHACL